jgi:hypothetical protein
MNQIGCELNVNFIISMVGKPGSNVDENGNLKKVRPYTVNLGDKKSSLPPIKLIHFSNHFAYNRKKIAVNIYALKNFDKVKKYDRWYQIEGFRETSGIKSMAKSPIYRSLEKRHTSAIKLFILLRDGCQFVEEMTVNDQILNTPFHNKPTKYNLDPRETHVATKTTDPGRIILERIFSMNKKMKAGDESITPELIAETKAELDKIVDTSLPRWYADRYAPVKDSRSQVWDYLVFYDYEAYPAGREGIFQPYMLAYSIYKTDPDPQSTYKCISTQCVTIGNTNSHPDVTRVPIPSMMTKQLFNEVNELGSDLKVLMLAHNHSFDLGLMLRHIKLKNEKIKYLARGPKTLNLSFRYGKNFFTFHDTWRLIPMALSKFGKSFNIPVCKEVIEHSMYTPKSIKYQTWDIRKIRVGQGRNVPSSEFLQELNANIDKWGLRRGQYRFSHVVYAAKYCIADVETLANGYMYFRKMTLLNLKVDINNYISNASVSKAFFTNHRVFSDARALQGTTLKYVRQAIVGGHTQVRQNKMWHYVNTSGDPGLNLVYMDFCSMYPHAIDQLEGVPSGKPTLFDNEHVSNPKIDMEFLSGVTYYVVTVNITKVGRTDLDINVLNHQPKGKGRVWEDKPGVYHLDKHGLELAIKVLDIEFNIDRGCYWNRGRNPLSSKYIKQLYASRAAKKAAKNPSEIVDKLTMNSFFGVTIQKTPEWEHHITTSSLLDKELKRYRNRIIDYRPVTGEEGLWSIKKFSPMANFAAYAHVGCEILSKSKTMMIELLVKNQDLGGTNWYTDTDSFLTFKRDMDRLTDYYTTQGIDMIGRKLGQLHSDLDPLPSGAKALYGTEAYILAKKFLYIKTEGANGEKGSHFRSKGIPTSIINKNDYERYFEGEPCTFDLARNNARMITSRRNRFETLLINKFERTISPTDSQLLTKQMVTDRDFKPQDHLKLDVMALSDVDLKTDDLSPDPVFPTRRLVCQPEDQKTESESESGYGSEFESLIRGVAAMSDSDDDSEDYAPDEDDSSSCGNDSVYAEWFDKIHSPQKTPEHEHEEVIPPRGMYPILRQTSRLDNPNARLPKYFGLYEYVDKRRVRFLIDHFDQVLKIMSKRGYEVDEWGQFYRILKMLLSEADQNGWIRTQPKSKSCGTHRRSYRLSLSKLSRPLRSALVDGLYTDIDLINAGPASMFHVVQQFGLDTPNLKNYIENREEYLKMICEQYNVDRDQAKKKIIASMFSGHAYIADPQNPSKADTLIEEIAACGRSVRAFLPDITKIRENRFLNSEDTRKNSFDESAPKNGQITSFLLMAIEDELLTEGILKTILPNLTTSAVVLCNDGLMVLNSALKENSHVSKIISNINQELEYMKYPLCRVKVKPNDQIGRWLLEELGYKFNPIPQIGDKIVYEKQSIPSTVSTLAKAHFKYAETTGLEDDDLLEVSPFMYQIRQDLSRIHFRPTPHTHSEPEPESEPLPTPFPIISQKKGLDDLEEDDPTLLFQLDDLEEDDEENDLEEDDQQWEHEHGHYDDVDLI